MMMGTAGLTAMLCVQALIDNDITPEKGDIIVTGASGGVGTIAITLLARLGYSVTAVTGRVEENGALLYTLGANKLIKREALTQPAKPLEKSLWAAAIDSVGGQMLAKILSQMQNDGVVTACGLAGGSDLPTSVMPFILRGVKLLGISSVQCPRHQRIQAWENIARLLPDSYAKTTSQEIRLDDVMTTAKKLVQGKVTGRTVIRLC
ncbi:MAG: zinc-binding dehydrogenase, partial [Ostreibacterium sp.]